MSDMDDVRAIVQKMQHQDDTITALRAEVERLRAALLAICMMDISWVGDAFKIKDIARAALEEKPDAASE